MNSIGWKILSALFVLLVTALGAAVPFWMRKRENESNGHKLLLMISGQLTSGVFIGAALLHLLPDALDKYVQNSSFNLNLPLLLAGCGLLFADLCQAVTAAAQNNPNLVLAAAALASQHDHVVLDNNEVHHHIGTICVVHGESVTGHELGKSPRHVLPKPKLSLDEDEFVGIQVESDICSSSCPDSPLIVRKSGCKDMQDKKHDHDHSSLHHSHIAVPAEGGLPYVIAVLLGFHSFIAGIALGASSTLDDMIVLLTAVLAHKWAESFALSLTLMKQSISIKRSLGIVILYSATCPIGIILAMVLSNVLADGVMRNLQVWFSSFACGSFLYIAAIHMLEEKDAGNVRCAWLLRLAAQVFGFSLMLVLAFII
jgi:zinc transporter ZupT